MSGSLVSSRSMDPADYLAMERSAPSKHQLWEGEVFAMAGASLAHNVVVANTTRLLGNLLRDAPCVVLPSDMKVWVPSTESYVYPDVSVVCGEPSLTDSVGDIIDNPCVLVEVLSESTERFDRGDKFAGYRSLPSVVDYVLVDPTRFRVEHFTRQDNGTWVLKALGRADSLEFKSVEGSILIEEIYLKVPGLEDARG